ncbi:MAG: sulfite exporter TauE/SafE family protein, partial [Calditrichia bacterium]|nr:sulfite exporter TauE/SafE family protein [Calditrichia bacterium]
MHKFKTYFSILSILLIALNFAAIAQDESHVTAQLIFPVEQMAKQNSYQVLIKIDIIEPWHINSNQPLEDFLIGTEISFEPIEGITFGKIQFPEPELKKFAFSEGDMSVYEGTIYALSTVTISPDLDIEQTNIKGYVYYQACDDQSCLPPTEITMEHSIPIVETGSEVNKANESLFAKVLPAFQKEEPAIGEKEKSIADVITESGMIYAFLFIFLGGLALNLTPCVYPLIPITISYFGGQSEGKKGGLVLRAVVYVLGMSITYSVLGVVASLTGGLLGSALQNPIVLIFVALVLVALALSMFGLYEIRVPQKLAMVGGANRSGYFGTMFMGLTVGLIAAPCIGPFVLGLLTYVGELGDPFLGFWMFFVLAMGLGTPFLFLGIFSGAATKLPRSGAWMIWVRNAFGFILIGMAIYFLEPLIPGENIYIYLMALVALVAGIYLGWIDKNKGQKGFLIIRNVVGVMFIAIAVFLAWPSDTDQEEGIHWAKFSNEALESAKANGKPVIIDFYA